MGDKVVSIKGQPIVPPGTVDPIVVAELERLLAQAQSGEISGIAYVTLFRDDCTNYSRVGRLTRAVLGTLELLKVSMCKSDIEDI